MADIQPHDTEPKLLEEDAGVIKAAAAKAAAGLEGWAAFAAVMNELSQYGFTLTRENLPNRRMNNIIRQWHTGPAG